MSAFPEQPFTEFEERYFLAEILKKSALPPTALLNVIRDAAIIPAWTEIALPNGRSVSSCQHAYQALEARTPPGPDSAAKRFKRPYSTGDATSNLTRDTTSNLTREIQPRPPAFASVNGQQPIPITSMAPVEPPRKKRGRPTKSEFERRQAEARERGEVWPKPRKAKARPSMEGVEATGPGTSAGAPAPVVEGSIGEGSGSATAGGDESSLISPSRPVPTAVMATPTTPGSVASAAQRKKRPFEGTVPSASRVQHEDLRAAEGVVSDTQLSEFQNPDQAMTSMRSQTQHAEPAHLQQHLPAQRQLHEQIQQHQQSHPTATDRAAPEVHGPYGATHGHTFQGYQAGGKEQ